MRTLALSSFLYLRSLSDGAPGVVQDPHADPKILDKEGATLFRSS